MASGPNERGAELACGARELARLPRQMFEGLVAQIAGRLPRAVLQSGLLDAGAAAMITLDRSEVWAGLVGEDRLEAVPVVVGERELRTWVRALAPDKDA